MTRTLLVLSLLFLGLPALAQSGNDRKFALRVQLGLLFSTPSSFNDQMATIVGNSPDIKTPKFNSIDLLWVFDSSILAGLRYDILDLDTNANHPGLVSAMDSKLRAERIDVLVGWRFLKLPKAYFGLISHLGVGGDKFKYELSKTQAAGGQEYKYARI